MEVKDILRKVDRQIAYLENNELYKKINQIEDIDSFSKEISSINSNKTNFEEGIIWMSIKEPKDDYDIVFLEKYHKFLNKILEIDSRDYLNNKYCNYLLSNSWDSLKNTNDKKFINNKSFDEIDEVITNKYNEIIEKINNGNNIDNKDKLFIEELFLFMAYNDFILKEIDGEESLMGDISNYFKKHPINNINNSRNKQLYLLYILSSRMVKFKGNSAIKFFDEITTNKNDTEVLGIYYKAEHDIAVIRINNVDIYNIKTDREFLKKVFTIFHELGHFIQDEKNEKYEKIQDIIDMEKSLIKNNSDFYDKYHDSFFIERDADNYAIGEIIDEFGYEYPEIVNSIIHKELGRKRIEASKFYLMELEEFGKMKIKKNKEK